MTGSPGEPSSAAVRVTCAGLRCSRAKESASTRSSSRTSGIGARRVLISTATGWLTSTTVTPASSRCRVSAAPYYPALHPYSAGGAYVNMMMDEGRERVHASYRDNYDRLARIKANYDPSNLFRVNQNIEPKPKA
jgi:Berberine and berberine like